MSPTFLKHDSFRFFVNSREETRRHIHVQSPDGEAKFWLEPEISLAVNFGLPTHRLTEIESIIKEKRDEFIRLWNTHFNQ
jgi:hypothetical protein